MVRIWWSHHRGPGLILVREVFPLPVPLPPTNHPGLTIPPFGASLMVQIAKNLLAMQETWVQSLGWEVTLEKGMTTHSSSLAWRIPWTEECGGLQSMGVQRVGHNWETNTFIFYFKEEEQVATESLKLFYLKNYHENKKYLYIKLFCILYIFQTMGYCIIITSKSTYKILDFSLYWASLVSLNFQVYIVLEWLTHRQSGSKY